MEAKSRVEHIQIESDYISLAEIWRGKKSLQQDWAFYESKNHRENEINHGSFY